MADQPVAPSAPTPNDAAPQNLPDPDSQKWADLAKELEGDGGEGDESKPDEAPPSEPRPDDEPAPEPDRPKPSYEQLEAAERGKHAALKEEREARRRAEESLANVNKLIEELRTARAQKQPEKEPEQPKLPDVDADPIGHFQARVQMLERALEATHKGSQATQQHIEAQQQEQVFWNHVRAAEDEFRKTAPKISVDGQERSDYDVACDYLKAHRMQELTHLYPDASPLAQQEARQAGMPSPAHLRAFMMHQDATGIANRAFQLGISPASLYYEAAKTRGYKSPPPKAANGNGKIEAAKRGQRAALTISGGEGRKSTNEMSRADLSELYIDDPEEFDRAWDRMKAAGKL